MPPGYELWPRLRMASSPSSFSYLALILSRLLTLRIVQTSLALHSLNRSLQVIIGSSSLIQLLSHRLVCIKQSGDCINQVIYLFLIIFTFHIRQTQILRNTIAIASLFRFMAPLDFSRLTFQERCGLFPKTPKKGLDAYVFSVLSAFSA